MVALLDVKNFQAAYGSTKVLFGIDFAVQESGISTILGANGAGKTTALRAVCGMLNTAGSVTFDGGRIDDMATEEIVRKGIAHVPEGRGTFASLSVEDNLTLGAYIRKDRDQVTSDFERVYDYFPVLRERRLQQAGTLSGGEQQMLAIARALMLKPRLMLLDEPSFGLAPLVVQDLFGILRQVNKNEGVSMLLVEQEANLALDLADQAYLLETGKVVISGAADDIKGDDSVRQAYLGY
mgnify:CR=1 FL=1|jgi:branched-chain amino acid transport system ATP-binding protein|tara:strand:+ start:1378 stop:2091 length:714 start_codon:yes stop_codon:yes gene_type:complete